MRNETRIPITPLPFNTALKSLAIAIRQEKKNKIKCVAIVNDEIKLPFLQKI